MWVFDVTFLALSGGWTVFFHLTSVTRNLKAIAIAYSALRLAKISLEIISVSSHPVTF